MTPEIKQLFSNASADAVAAYARLIEAAREAEARLNYSGDTFNDQGCLSRRDACWQAAEALGAALSSLAGVEAAPAPGTPSAQGNMPETVVTRDTTDQASTTLPDDAISRSAQVAHHTKLKDAAKAEALLYREAGDNDSAADCLMEAVLHADEINRLRAEPALPEPVSAWQGIDLSSRPDQTVVSFINPSQAALDVLAERQRQIRAEGWTPEHDDAHRRAELASAASCYAWPRYFMGSSLPMNWPWSATWWKPSDRRRDLVKSGALILAEIERLDRATKEGATA